MKKSLSILAALSFLTLLAGCTEPAEQGAQSKSQSPNATDEVVYHYSYSKTNERNPIEESSAVTINGDVMWGIGKTVDEVTEKYGSAAAAGPTGVDNVFKFENGYGTYIFGDGCENINEVSAGDLLVGDLATVTLDNIAEKCGFNVVPIHDSSDLNTMYEGYRVAYYTHPSYKNVTFGMLYKESGFDETASFSVRYFSAAATDDLIITLNSVIDSAADVDALNSGIKSADTGELTAEVRVFENPTAFVENNEMSAGALKDGAVILVELSDGSCYITTRGERTTEIVPMPEMLAHIVQRADSAEQLKAELDGYARGGRNKAVSRVTIYRDSEAMLAGSDVGKTIIENGELVGTDDDLKNSGTMARVEYDGGESYIDFSLTEF